MNEANEIMFYNFLTNNDALEEINQQHDALFEELIDAGKLDGVALVDLKVDTLRVGFYAGVAAAYRMMRAKTVLAMRNKRQLERSRGEA